jgi:hypothetical protein
MLNVAVIFTPSSRTNLPCLKRRWTYVKLYLIICETDLWLRDFIPSTKISYVFIPHIFNFSGRLRILTCEHYDRWRLHKGRFCIFGPKMEVLRTLMEFCQGNCFFSGGANISIKQTNFVISQNSMWLRNVLSYSTWPSSCIRENCTTCTFKPIFFRSFPWLALISHKVSAVPILLLSRIPTSIRSVFQPC